MVFGRGVGAPKDKASAAIDTACGHRFWFNEVSGEGLALNAGQSDYLNSDLDAMVVGVRRCIETLEAHGGIMTPTAFAKAADVPAARLDGLIARVQRLLNVDGYEILTLNRTENRIELNAAKLKRQFDVE